MSDQFESAPRLHAVAAAAERIGMSRSRLYELFAAGELRSVKVGRRRLIPESAIAEYIARVEATCSA